MLAHGSVSLRPLRRRDAGAWRRARAGDASWLRPWEATLPAGSGLGSPSFRTMVTELRRQAGRGRALPFAVCFDDVLVGQVTVGGITWGSARSGQAGYWIDSRFAGRSIIPIGVALAVDHCFQQMGLHRIEVAIRPENTASLRVVEKLGFRHEGHASRYLHIDGDWRDHDLFALTADEVPAGVLRRLVG